MKLTAMFAMAAAALGAQGARVGGPAKSVPVYMSNAHIATAAFFAQDQAAKLFAEAGIAIEWRSVGHAALPDGAIVVDLVQQSDAAECRGSLACAQPFEGVHIRVFFDRLRGAAGGQTVPALLAHVLVHEITHILEGADNHALTGVMKARWNDQDFDAMRRGALHFTETDVQLIRLGVAAREARQAKPEGTR